jgi:preprotein translocase subunit SecA
MSKRYLDSAEFLLTPYLERRVRHANALDRAILSCAESVQMRFGRGLRQRQATLDLVLRLAQETGSQSSQALLDSARMLRPQLLRHGFTAPLVAKAFALAREATFRHAGLRHFPVQIMGGLGLLDGTFVEMQTGEGKTITALLPAVAAALRGEAVHIVTVNDYLAKRDAAILEPVFRLLGLTVGLIESGQDLPTRRAAYACDVTYCTNKELVFDYLKDRITARQQEAARLGLRRQTGPVQQFLLRGLNFAIIDEADSILIDEARTPLIISAELADQTLEATVHAALALARQLVPQEHYHLLEQDRIVRLTERGSAAIAERAHRTMGIWQSRRARDELVGKALTALHLLNRDRHYIVVDGKVQIVDEYTGRTMPDRSWEKGLHQLIEAKENCALTGPRESLAQITYQRFFRRYARLSGMSGTFAEVVGEMRSVYGLSTVQIPTNRPCKRRDQGLSVYRTANDKWAAVVETARSIAAIGRPVLIGTQSVSCSEHVSELFQKFGVPHVVLNARQDALESETVAAAGQKGCITVATNMAGRGTDIGLGQGVSALGGLHVILTEFHDSCRIDRQLFGRAGRQGDEGSYEAIVSLEDELFARYVPRLAWFAKYVSRPEKARGIGWFLRRSAQARAGRHHARERRDILRRDEQLERVFAFAGKQD